MEILNKIEVLERLCKEANKYGIFISFSDGEDYGRIIADAPYLAVVSQIGQVVNDGEGWLLFDTEEEMNNCYNQTEEDGCVYALTCNSRGQIETENT